MSNQLYNTKMELGLHCLFILNELYPEFCGLDRLLYLDYLSLYIEDFKADTVNLHPKYPFQSIEIMEKRKILKNSLFDLVYKGLIDVDIYGGLSYGGNANTLWLVDSMQNIYSSHLKENIALVIQEMRLKTDKELKTIIFNNKIDEQNVFNNFYPYSEEV